MEITASAGFNLRGIVSNSRRVLAEFPTDSLATDYQNIDLLNTDLPNGRVLGVYWKVGSDEFSFKIGNLDKPFNRRGMLSVIGSLFDPLGFVTPILVPARSLFQQTCSLKLDCDSPLPAAFVVHWKSWLNELSLLENFSIPRCSVCSLGNVICSELHVFCDGSLTAYCAVAYERWIDCYGEIACGLIASKTRQTPVAGGVCRTIPRIELNAAKLAVTLAERIKRESNVEFNHTYFWSDSQTVLKYIRSESGRFLRFVENRVNFIHEHSNVCDWRFVPGNLNVADVGSRGVTVCKFITMTEWVKGPKFLWDSELSMF